MKNEIAKEGEEAADSLFQSSIIKLGYKWILTKDSKIWVWTKEYMIKLAQVKLQVQLTNLETKKY
jgi:hypothetical protein